MMALLKSRRDATVAEVDVQNEESYDVLSLRRAFDHPAVRPLIERREALRQRLEALAQERHQHEQTMANIERSEAVAISIAGEDWSWPAPYIHAKEGLEDVKSQERIILAALGQLSVQIEETESEARDAIENALNQLRRPVVAAVAEILKALVEPNRRLHEIERVSQKLLQTARWHTYDATLEGRLGLIERTKALLDLSTQDAVRDAG
jgi:hypothetical protein